MALDVKELRGMGAGELQEKEQQLVQELFTIRFQFGPGRLENPMQRRNEILHELKRSSIRFGAKPTNRKGKGCYG